MADVAAHARPSRPPPPPDPPRPSAFIEKNISGKRYLGAGRRRTAEDAVSTETFFPMPPSDSDPGRAASAVGICRDVVKNRPALRPPARGARPPRAPAAILGGTF